MSTQPERSRSRRLLWGGALALAAGAIAWQIAKRAIDVEQYRPQIEAAIEEYTGLAVTIGGLELAWHPMPCLSALDVSVGEGDFRAVTARLDVFPRLLPLLRRRVEISRIDLTEPTMTLPAARNRLESEWRRVIEHIQVARGKVALRAEAGSTDPRIQIDELVAHRALLHFGERDARPIMGSITATGIGRDELEIHLEAEIPDTGAHVEGALRVPSQEGREGSGELTISGVKPGDFVPLPVLIRSEWQGSVAFSGKLGEEVSVTIDGRFEPLEAHAIGGRFSGHAKIAPDGKTRADLEITGEGLSIQSTARLFAGDRSRVRIKSARARGPALAALLEAISRDPVELRAARDAAIDVRDLGLSIASAPQITSGAIRAHGVQLYWRGAPIVPELRLDARAAEGAIQIAELRGGPIDLRGAITPDNTARSVALDLAGTIRVDEALLHALGAPPEIRAASGALALEALHAELPASADGGPHYTVRAQLAGGSLQIESDAYAENISGIDLRLSGDEAALRFDGRARGAALGKITADVELDSAMSRAHGTLALEDVRADFLRNTGARARFSPLLRTYSGLPIAFEIQRDAEPPHVQRIRFERAAAPRVNAALVLRSEPREDPLRDLDVAADLPAEALTGFLPEAAQTSGVGSLRVRRSGGGAGFFAEADLGGLGIATGQFLEKKAGEPLTVRVEGVAGERWEARKLILAAERAEIAAAIGKGGLSAPDLDIDLSAFSFLLVDGARASGRLRGSFDTATESAKLQLVDVGVWLTPDLSVDAADGEIAVAGDNWGVRNLRVRGRESDATLDIAVQSDQLRGRVVGERIDAEFAREFFEQLDALEFPEREPDTSPGISGNLAIAVDHVFYHRADAEHLSAAVSFEHDDIHIRDLAFEVGAGRVTGRADVDRRDPEPPLLDLELDFSNLPRRFLDDLSNAAQVDGDAPGSTGGTWVGKLRFTAPLHDDLRAMMPDGSGSLTATGTHGTLVGRLGLTTRIVTVLRSTEALRMKFPTIRDEGIVYDSVRGDLVMNEGRVEIRSIELDSTSYAMSATGELNFREDTSRVPIEVNAIRGITTSFVERVPVAGDALKIVNVRMVATGSPYDMQVRIASIQDQLIGAGLAGPKAVIKGVRDVMNLMRRAGSGQSAPSPEAVPAPSPAAPPDTDARSDTDAPLAPAPEPPAPAQPPQG